MMLSKILASRTWIGQGMKVAVSAAFVATLALAAIAPIEAQAATKQQQKSQPAKRKPDLADQVAGTYVGNVISDARGSSTAPGAENLTVTITRTGPNQVELRCDYPRIPTTKFKLERVSSTIQNRDTDNVFLIDLNKDRGRLDLSIDDASLTVQKRASGK